MRNQCLNCLTRLKFKMLYFWIGLSILAIDQISKALVFFNLPLIHFSNYSYPYGGIGVFENFLGIEFSLNHMTNSGAAWGLFGSYQLPLIIFRILLIGVMIIYLINYNRQDDYRLPLTMIIAGAIGNVCDYFLYGHVIDMFHMIIGSYDFPIFNVADASISLGVAYLFLLSFLKK